MNIRFSPLFNWFECLLFEPFKAQTHFALNNTHNHLNFNPGTRLDLTNYAKWQPDVRATRCGRQWQRRQRRRRRRRLQLQRQRQRQRRLLPERRLTGNGWRWGLQSGQAATAGRQLALAATPTLRVVWLVASHSAAAATEAAAAAAATAPVASCWMEDGHKLSLVY